MFHPMHRTLQKTAWSRGLVMAVVLMAAMQLAAAVAPPAPVDDPSADIQRDRHGAQHTVYLRLPAATADETLTDRIVAQLTSLGQDGLSVPLQGQRLPDGRLQFTVILNPAWESRYRLSIIDTGPFVPRRLYEGSFQAIPLRPQR